MSANGFPTWPVGSNKDRQEMPILVPAIGCGCRLICVSFELDTCLVERGFGIPSIRSYVSVPSVCPCACMTGAGCGLGVGWHRLWGGSNAEVPLQSHWQFPALPHPPPELTSAGRERKAKEVGEYILRPGVCDTPCHSFASIVHGQGCHD